MKATGVVGRAAVAFLSLSTTAAALAWPRWLPEVDSLIVRADSTSSSAATTATPTPSSSAAKTTNTAASAATKLNTAGLSTDLITTTDSAGSTIVATANTTGTTHTTFNAQDPAGGITMVTPGTTSGVTQLYRIGEYVTWVWNYTSLSATPTALDLLVSCSKATETWTLTQNMTFQSLGSYTWDTGAYQASATQSPLLTEMYTIVIYEAGSSVSATAEAGYLAVYTGFTFGLYTGRPYTPLSDYVCATCSGAMSDMERRAVGVAVITSIVTVLSFTWFVAGFGALL